MLALSSLLARDREILLTLSFSLARGPVLALGLEHVHLSWLLSLGSFLASLLMFYLPPTSALTSAPLC